MDKTTNAIKMLSYLSAGQKYSKTELSKLIGTNEKNIYGLKLQLEKAGFKFKDLKGRYGGYALEMKALLCLPQLSDVDRENLYDLYYRIADNENFLNHSNITDTLRKILMLLPLSSSKPIVRISTDENEDISDFYTVVKQAINNRKSIIGIYASSSSVKKRHLNPHDLVSVNNNWYCIADDIDNQEFKIYKLNRFKSLSITNDTYSVLPSYKLTDHVDAQGFVNIGDSKRLILKISGPYIKALIEKPIGHHVVIENFDSFIHYHVDLRGDIIIKEFILKMGSNCQVIEPAEVKEMIRDEYVKCYEHCKL